MRVGFSEEPITPPRPEGHALAGYIARRGKSTGVHDDIFVRATALEGERLVLALSFDLLGVDEEMRSDVERLARRVYGGCTIVAAATHTHSAPASLFRSPLLTFCEESFDPDYYSHFMGVVEKALEEAEPSARGSAFLCESRVVGVATDRNDPGRLSTLKARTLVFDAGSWRAAVVNVGLHPTVLGPDNLLISADLVGYALARLRARGGFRHAVFFNGAAGNVSTRFTRRSQTFSEAERLGFLLADQLAAPLRCRRVSLEGVEAKRVDLELDLEDPREKISAATGVESRAQPRDALREGVLLLERFSECAGYPKRAAARVTLLRLGELAVLALPFEVDTHLLEELEAEARESGLEDLLLFSYADGYLGYLPGPVGGLTYEKLAQLVKDESYERLRSSLLQLLR